MGRPRKVVVEKSYEELFDVRFESRPNFRAFMMNVVGDTDIINDGALFSKHLKENVFKHQNTFFEVETRGDENYVYANIDDNVAEHRKYLTYAKLNKYGFFLTTYNDKETWLYVPVANFVAGQHGRYHSNAFNKKVLGANSVIKKRTRKTKTPIV